MNRLFRGGLVLGAGVISYVAGSHVAESAVSPLDQASRAIEEVINPATEARMDATREATKHLGSVSISSETLVTGIPAVDSETADDIQETVAVVGGTLAAITGGGTTAIATRRRRTSNRRKRK